MKATYFKASRRFQSGYEKDLITAWGLSRRTAPLVSKLRDMTGDEWQLSDNATSRAASALRDMGFEAFVEFTAKKAADIRKTTEELREESGDDGSRQALLEESVGTLRKNEYWEGSRIVRH